jgi:hypothetical protein
MVLVADLFELLLDATRRRVRNGHVTERGLARRAGISQAHMHNVLKGARLLTPSTADRLLRALDLTVADLIGPTKDSGSPGRHSGPA